MGKPRSLSQSTRKVGTGPTREAHIRRWVVGVSAMLLVGLGLAGYYLRQSQAGRFLPAAISLPPGAATGFNVVLFTLDTLRADHVGCYGYEGVETPTLDALAAGGVRFADAVATVPTTLPSHSTIMTGNYPPVHGVRDNGSYRLVDKHVTLAERLKAKGYATAAFIGAFVLDRRYGLAQGFDVYDDDITQKYRVPGTNPVYPERPGNIVTDSAIEWLEEYHATRSGRPFFMWIHLFDPHTPYTPPEPFKTRYQSNLYDGEVAFTDQQVGRFLEKLRQLRLFDRTVIVAVGDHGEGLGDHGERTHGLLIYDATMHVPLVFHAPALTPGGRVVDDRVVATVDVAPTVLDLLGFDPGGCDGLSLLRPSRPDRAVYLETLHPKLSHGWSPLYGLRRHTDKYISAPTPEYYDLRDDPGEGQNLWQKHSVHATALADRLTTLMGSFPAEEQTSDAALTPTAEALAKLAALGYVGGEVPAHVGPPADPKEMVLGWERQLKTVRELVARGRFGEAIPLLTQALDITPNDPELWLLLSDAQANSSLYDDAIASRQKAIELLPNESGEQWVQLARLQYAKADTEAAGRSLMEAERLEPDHGGIYLIRAEMALDAGQYELALRHCAEARRRDPTRQAFASWSLQGRVYEQMGELAKARSAYEHAQQSDPSDLIALLDLAELDVREGQYRRALELAQKVPPQHALWARSRTLLARAYLELGQADMATRVMNQLVDAEPRSAAAHYNLALILRDQGKTEDAVRQLRKAVALEPDSETARCELARLLGVRGELDEAIQIIERLLASAPGYAPAYPQAATLFSQQAQPDRAIEVLRRGRALFPNDPGIANHLAWLLATSAGAEPRNGAEAVELAEFANKLTDGKYSSVLDTLAAAYAEAGRFDEAVTAAKRALELARQAHDDDLASAIEARLDLYQKQRPYRQP